MAPRTSEHAIQAAVAEFLGAALPANGVAWTSIDKALAGTRIGGADKRGVKSGWPDVQFLWKGRFIAIELKATGGKLRTEQVTRRAEIIAAGGFWHEARSVEAVEAILRGHGMPLRASATDHWRP